MFTTGLGCRSVWAGETYRSRRAGVGQTCACSGREVGCRARGAHFSEVPAPGARLPASRSYYWLSPTGEQHCAESCPCQSAVGFDRWAESVSRCPLAMLQGSCRRLCCAYAGLEGEAVVWFVVDSLDQCRQLTGVVSGGFDCSLQAAAFVGDSVSTQLGGGGGVYRQCCGLLRLLSSKVEGLQTCGITL